MNEFPVDSLINGPPTTTRTAAPPLTACRMWTPPWLASTTLNEGRHVGQVPSYVRPLDAAIFGRGPVWFSSDRIQIAYASSKALRHAAGFSDPVSLTVCPYFVRRPARTRLGPSPTRAAMPRVRDFLPDRPYLATVPSTFGAR